MDFAGKSHSRSLGTSPSFNLVWIHLVTFCSSLKWVVPKVSATFSGLNMMKPKLLCVAVFVPCLLLLTYSTNYGFSSLFITIPILIIPTTVFLFKPTKEKVTLSENPSHQDEQISSRVPISFPEDGNQVSQESDGDGNMLEYQVESLDFPSDSESCSSDELLTSEGIELNWVGYNNVGQFLAISEEEEEDEDEDEDDDDDDGLIEINLPGNDLTEEYKQDFLPESVFKQQDLMELLTELDKVTEEENLIEIDLSMGSIKFELEA